MSLPNIGSLESPQLLDLYARVKLNIMLSRMFNRSEVRPEIYQFAHELSEEISNRGLDSNETT